MFINFYQLLKKLQAVTTDSVSELENSIYCVNVIGSMLDAVENKSILNCNRLLIHPELENLAAAVALHIYHAEQDTKNGEAKDNDKVKFYKGVSDYICGPDGYNFQIKELIKDYYNELKDK